MTDEEILGTDDMLWTAEGRKRILAMLAQARADERAKVADILKKANAPIPFHEPRKRFSVP